jgi:hypothetical protein
MGEGLHRHMEQVVPLHAAGTREARPGRLKCAARLRSDGILIRGATRALPGPPRQVG